MTTMIVIDHDCDADFSWLEQDIYDPSKPGYEPIYASREDADAGRNRIDGEWYRDPANHVALSMVAYDDEDTVVDSLGNIDFLADGDDWHTGTITSLRQLDCCPYLRELAAEMGLA